MKNNKSKESINDSFWTDSASESNEKEEHVLNLISNSIERKDNSSMNNISIQEEIISPSADDISNSEIPGASSLTTEVSMEVAMPGNYEIFADRKSHFIDEEHRLQSDFSPDSNIDENIDAVNQISKDKDDADGVNDFFSDEDVDFPIYSATLPKLGNNDEDLSASSSSRLGMVTIRERYTT